MGALFFETRVDVLPVEGLEDRIKGALEAFVLFLPEDRGGSFAE